MQKFEVFFVIKRSPLSIKWGGESFIPSFIQPRLIKCLWQCFIHPKMHSQNNSLLFYVWIREGKHLPIKPWHAVSCKKNSCFINVKMSKEIYTIESVTCGDIQVLGVRILSHTGYSFSHGRPHTPRSTGDFKPLCPEKRLASISSGEKFFSRFF